MIFVSTGLAISHSLYSSYTVATSVSISVVSVFPLRQLQRNFLSWLSFFFPFELWVSVSTINDSSKIKVFSVEKGTSS